MGEKIISENTGQLTVEELLKENASLRGQLSQKEKELAMTQAQASRISQEMYRYQQLYLTTGLDQEKIG